VNQVCTKSESEPYITTDGQSASLSWNKAPGWGLRPDFYYCQTVAGLLMWGVLSDLRTGLSFTIAAGPRQRSHSRVLAQFRDFPFRGILFPLIIPRQGPRTETTAVLLLRVCLLGYQRDRYTASLLALWLLPSNGLGPNHIENTAPVLLAAFV
jgi:hypothetical protein